MAMARHIWLRASALERQAIERAARAEGLTLSAFVRKVTLAAVDRRLAGNLGVAVPVDIPQVEVDDDAHDGD